MSDLSVTAANVISGSDDIGHGTAGGTITAGQPVYRDSTTGHYLPADSNSATAAAHLPVGIALHGAADGQPLAFQRSGDITIGATLTAGTTYYLSATAGGICPAADLTTGMVPCIVGIAASTSVLRLAFRSAGAAL
jgi:hypothetical protein